MIIVITLSAPVLLQLVLFATYGESVDIQAIASDFNLLRDLLCTSLWPYGYALALLSVRQLTSDASLHRGRRPHCALPPMRNARIPRLMRIGTTKCALGSPNAHYQGPMRIRRGQCAWADARLHCRFCHRFVAHAGMQCLQCLHGHL